MDYLIKRFLSFGEVKLKSLQKISQMARKRWGRVARFHFKFRKGFLSLSWMDAKHHWKFFFLIFLVFGIVRIFLIFLWKISKKTFPPKNFLKKEKINKNFLLKFLTSKTSHLEIQSQPIMKLSEKPLYSWKISRKKYLEDLSRVLSLQIRDFGIDLSWFCMASNPEPWIFRFSSQVFKEKNLFWK